jgi:hypothetical protein
VSPAKPIVAEVIDPMNQRALFMETPLLDAGVLSSPSIDRTLLCLREPQMAGLSEYSHSILFPAPRDQPSGALGDKAKSYQLKDWIKHISSTPATDLHRSIQRSLVHRVNYLGHYWFCWTHASFLPRETSHLGLSETKQSPIN